MEYGLLKRKLERGIGAIRPGGRSRNRTIFASLLAGSMALAGKIALDGYFGPIVSAVLVVGLFGVVYFIAGALAGLEEARRICARFGLRFD